MLRADVAYTMTKCHDDMLSLVTEENVMLSLSPQCHICMSLSLGLQKLKNARSQKLGQPHREGLATWRFIVTERCVCDAYRSRAGALYRTAVASWQNVEQRGRPECTRRAAGRIPVICQAALSKQQGMSLCQVVWKWAKQ